MDIEKIENAETKILAKKVIYYKQTTSTQEVAKEMANKGVKNGTLIITDKQTNGIGTNGRVWYSNIAKNITMTLIIYPHCNIEKLEGLTVNLANILKETIKELYNIDLQIKKPNDLLLNNKKIAGILTQAVTYENIVKYVLIGIGVNINETEFFPEIQNIATSLKREYKKDFQREEIIVRILEKLENNLIKQQIIQDATN